MNEFRERLYGEKSKELFAPMIPNIVKVAEMLVANAKQKFSDSQYAGSTGRTLTVSWAPMFKVWAEASVLRADENRHQIVISYGAALEIYKDSVLFLQMCDRVFAQEQFDALFLSLEYGKGRKSIIPAELTDRTDTKILFNDISMTWLYLHEQAHLFQAHGSVFAKHSDGAVSGDTLLWEDFPAAADREEWEGSRNSWIKHACELSADHEATSLIMQYLMSKDFDSGGKGTIAVSSIWLLIAGLVCIFHRFYGDAREHHGGVAKGTHPDPAIRMKFIFFRIMHFLKHPRIQEYHQEGKTLKDYAAAMDHAFATANLYVMIAHLNIEGVPEFMERFDEETSDYKKYREGIRNIWLELRPTVMDNYTGHGESSVMPIIEEVK